ncbi:MAG TPA: SpoIIE family protein phosphatase, partial [Tenuifilaceae bacterium]|nr:SpoIIE family protein phosphatase [Tenuifilaceae bacterium]
YFNLHNNQQIVLEPDTKTIQFEFSALDYSSPLSIAYSYILEGFDDTLVYTTSMLRIAKYSNLPPGNYVLRINATNADGVWSANPFVLKITVKKPFYLKLWFLLLAFAAVFGAVYLIIKWREKWLRSENVRLDRIVLERTAEVTQQNEEIRAQRDIIVNQSEEIKQVNLHLTDSIEYALSLQNAMMPSETEMRDILGDHFLVFKPKDIVSGDFYWIKGNPQHFTIILADCTGHGVHGGFMSMLGLSFVSEIYDSSKNPYEIVKGIHRHFTDAITLSGEKKFVTTGMDIGVCCVDREKGKLTFAGTRLPLYLIKMNGKMAELVKFKSGKKPVGSPWFTDDIPLHEAEIESGDTVVISTDGAFDQLSRVERKRFNRAHFEELLVQICGEPMQEQGKIIDERLTSWQGGGVQTDDISVLGFRI